MGSGKTKPKPQLPFTQSLSALLVRIKQDKKQNTDMYDSVHEVFCDAVLRRLSRSKWWVR